MIELLLGVLLAGAAVWFVLVPVLRPERRGTGNGERGMVEEGEDPDDDLSPRAVALRALKEIDFDRATGKLSDADYEALRAQYTVEALAALREGDAGKGKGEGSQRPKYPSPFPRPASPVCPTCGSRPDPDAVFCASCGRRLAASPGFCSRCGTGLEADARYCGRCGVPVAA